MSRFRFGFAVVFSLGVLHCASAPDASTVGPASENEIQAEVATAEARGVAPVGRKALHELRGVAPNVTLAMLGEDDGLPCTATFRVGPASQLSAEEALRLFGFDVGKQLSSDTFWFQMRDPRDQAFWDDFKTFQQDAAAAQRVAEILSAPEVLGLATMIVEDHEPLRAPAFLVALMKDRSLVGLRGTIGGMTL